MKQLYCPWRSKYAGDIAHNDKEHNTTNMCVFCDQFDKHTDDTFFILKRFTYNAVMMNRYPYNAGHLLIIPFEHKAHLHELPRVTRSELMELANQSVIILQNQLHAHGFNIGLNLGKAAGAGIPQHLHMHVLPRFFGDTNFLPLIGETKQISFDLNNIFKQLKSAFEKISL